MVVGQYLAKKSSRAHQKKMTKKHRYITMVTSWGIISTSILGPCDHYYGALISRLCF